MMLGPHGIYQLVSHPRFPLLLCITAGGLMYLWNIISRVLLVETSLKLMEKEKSISDIINSIEITDEESILIILDTSEIYIFDRQLESWCRIADQNFHPNVFTNQLKSQWDNGSVPKLLEKYQVIIYDLFLLEEHSYIHKKRVEREYKYHIFFGKPNSLLYSNWL
eukprot:TRINITY_DN3017_c0_g1_i2.p1 TRINITY_DN3017_c0_g1~~TRINITY_DN3017_c0_g1_i2.p1  ORF type:complete len:165 (+),score=23.07 TRINITY_DN3017_c0_g1_i2:254-748(+)